MGKDARRTYTPEQKQEALALYLEHGPAETSRRTGIRAGTIRQWARRGGVTSPRAERAVAGAEAARKSWAQRRATVCLAAGEAAEELIGKVRESPDARKAADWARAFAIATDKAQLLDGGATGRVEVSSAEERERRVAELRDELAARRASR